MSGRAFVTREQYDEMQARALRAEKCLEEIALAIEQAFGDSKEAKAAAGVLVAKIRRLSEDNGEGPLCGQ